MADELTKMKLTSFFKTVIIELDKEAYGPDNHVTEWHRGNPEEECDGFSVSYIPIHKERALSAW